MEDKRTEQYRQELKEFVINVFLYLLARSKFPAINKNEKSRYAS